MRLQDIPTGFLRELPFLDFFWLFLLYFSLLFTSLDLFSVAVAVLRATIVLIVIHLFCGSSYRLLLVVVSSRNPGDVAGQFADRQEGGAIVNFGGTRRSCVRPPPYSSRLRGGQEGPAPLRDPSVLSRRSSLSSCTRHYLQQEQQQIQQQIEQQKRQQIQEQEQEQEWNR